MFKVGQRVWLIKEKRMGTIGAYAPEWKRSCAVLFDDERGNTYEEADLHETADDMFEKLGFWNDKETVYIVMYFNKETIISFVLTEKNIYKKPIGYTTYGIITPDIHLAIHQKGREMGWW